MRLSDFPLFSYLRKIRPGEKRFLLLVPLVGLATGFAAVALVRLLAAVQKLFWGSGRELVRHAEELPALHRFLAPVLGGLLVALIILITRRPVRGHGTAGIIEAVTRHRGVVPLPRSLVKAGATMFTVGSGGSLGREGPMMRVGAALGSLLGRRSGMTGNRLTILVGCGTAAGIAAAYNAPIGGALFALEVILGSFALESFGPIVVASAMGTIVSRGLLGNYTAYTPPPLGALVSFWEMGHYILMGVLVGGASALFLWTLKGAEVGFDRLRIPIWSKPILGFALVGLIGIRFPQVFGNGYETTDRVLHEALPLELILILPLLKVAATALTMGSGGAGGLFTPTLFVGSLLGYAYGAWVHIAFPAHTASPGVYALVGMGAMIAGTTQAPLTAILMIFELTGDYEIILPLMVCCTVSLIAGRALHRESLYTEPLLERGVRLGGRMEQLVMDKIEVRDLMRQGAAPVRDDAALEVVMKRLLNEGRKELFVVDAAGAFRGTITLADLTGFRGGPEELQKVTAGEVLYSDVPVLFLTDRVTDAIARWSQVSRDRLPVVDGPETRRYVGELSAGDIIFLYSQEVLGKESRLARFDRDTGGEARPETTYVELPEEYVVALVTLPEPFPPTTLRELDARRRFGVNVIEIKRRLGADREHRIIPGPDTEMRGGDALIVVGRPSDIAHLADPVRLAEIREAARVSGTGGGTAPDEAG
jgi:CIC family chloride channel protein